MSDKFVCPDGGLVCPYRPQDADLRIISVRDRFAEVAVRVRDNWHHKDTIPLPQVSPLIRDREMIHQDGETYYYRKAQL